MKPHSIPLALTGVLMSSTVYGQVFSDQIRAFHEDWPTLRSQKVQIEIDHRLAEEEFRLTLGKSPTLRAGSPAAVSWGLQALGESAVQKGEIHDKPAYGFRCVTIDVARRFHSLSTLRQIVRWCQAGRVRFLQLHLTDDQNWMLPTRTLAGVDRNNGSGHPAYTRDEMRELQAFAWARGISVIPEIDIPGHSSLLVRSDPALFSIKGSASTNCINFGSPKVREKMRSLIREIADVFPKSPYIHIGGDEAWYPDAEKDPEIGPKPSEVFVDFVADMANTVLSLKKTPIVWEGFGRTDYARKRIPAKTVVIAWEGAYYPAKALVEDGFQVVNAGWDPYYVVNHYPYDAYTLVPLPTLYRRNPKIFGIVNWSLGTSGTVDLQPKGNLRGSMLCWWEGREWNVRATLPLRILAFGARLWNPSSTVPYDRFLQQSKATLDRIHARTVPFRMTVDGLMATAKSGDPSLTFGMRSDGEIPTNKDLRTKLEIKPGSVVTVQAFRGSVPVGETEFFPQKEVRLVDNLALHARVTASTPEDPQFPASIVTDGVASDVGSFWLGYPLPGALTIDLDKAKRINRVDVVPFWAAGQATQYLVEVSLDGKTWTLVADATRMTEAPTEAGYIHRFSGRDVRYIRVRITGTQQFPPSMARIHEVRAFLDPQNTK